MKLHLRFQHTVKRLAPEEDSEPSAELAHPHDADPFRSGRLDDARDRLHDRLKSDTSAASCLRPAGVRR